jgi:hypothetical protein
MESHYLYSFLESHLQPFLQVVVVLIAIQPFPYAYHGIMLPLFHSTTFSSSHHTAFICAHAFLYLSCAPLSTFLWGGGF